MIDFRLALRSLVKTPLVTTVAVLSLALGIGANAAIFAIFERMVLRPLPVQQPDQLVNLLSPGPKPGSQSTNQAGGMDSVFSYPMFRDLEAAQTPFTGLAAHRTFGANLSFGGATESGVGMLVSGRYFEVLGLRPATGRLIQPADDTTVGAHTVVVLDHGYWTTRFEARPSVVGETLVVNGVPLTILGVAPEGFSGTTLGEDPKVYVPITLNATLTPGWEGFENRRSYWVYLFGRLRPGVSLAEADAALAMPYRRLIQEVEAPLQEGMSERTLEQFHAKALLLEPGARGQSSAHGEAGKPLLLLLGVTGFVLLIACANLANLLLVRAVQRSNEIALRMSIGARRWQVVAQLLTESFLLAAAGGLLGLLTAHATLKSILALVPTSQIAAFGFTIGPKVWLFLALLSLLTGLAGLFPALHCTRDDLVTALKGTGRTATSRGANRFRAALVTFQVALSVMLLISAGLFTKSLLNVSRVELGLEVEHIASFAVSPKRNGYSPEDARNFYQRVEEETAALPGVRQVVASRVPLLANSNWGSNVSVQGFDAGPDTDTHSNFNEVGVGFFRTLGIPLLAGREFEPRDTLDTPKVAVVNETFAEKFGLGRGAVGQRMQVGSGGELDIEIIGLARDTKYSEVKQVVPPLFFLPYRQNEDIGSVSFYVRAMGDPRELLGSLRGAVATLDPNLPVDNLQTLAQQTRENVFLDRLLSTLSAAFAILATLLAAIGLYGVLAFSVAQRRREIGLRMALGADAGKVWRLILSQMGRLIAVGTVLGVLAALAVGRAARSLLFELEGHDPMVFAGSVLVLVLVALGSGLLPARRAARIDPMRALREE